MTAQLTMTSSRKAFGAFVAAKRQAAGLTQRELAQRLFVTESAVSKWERGLSYPDISLVAPLARELDVSESELINSSDDRVARQVVREARVYRRWKTSVLWSTSVAYALAALTCFIVNLTVGHTLDWFWVVLTGLAVAFSLTTLPLLPTQRLSGQRRGWTVLGAFLVSLFALFAATWLLYGGGNWLAIAITSVLFAAVMVLGPVLLHQRELPAAVAGHRTVLALAADTLALAVLLLVVALALQDLSTTFGRSLAIAALAVVFAWVPALVIRYLRLPGLFRAAIIVAFVGLYEFFVTRPLIPAIAGTQPHHPVDLRRWDETHINGNVSLIAMLSLLLVAVILATAAAVRSGRARPVGPRLSRGR